MNKTTIARCLCTLLFAFPVAAVADDRYDQEKTSIDRTYDRCKERAEGSRERCKSHAEGNYQIALRRLEQIDDMTMRHAAQNLALHEKQNAVKSCLRDWQKERDLCSWAWKRDSRQALERLQARSQTH